MSHLPQPLDLHDLVTELTRTHTHRERYDIRERGHTLTRSHFVRVPSLLVQLEYATAASTGEAGAGGFGSRPAAYLESLDTLVGIDTEASRWVRDLGEDDPSSTAACISRLHALAASAEQPAREAIEHDVRRWWAQARVVTGWDSPAWRPHSTCPMCAARGTLRVRLSSQTGLCIDCRETWTPETIGLLADHIRLETNADPEDTNPEQADTQQHAGLAQE